MSWRPNVKQIRRRSDLLNAENSPVSCSIVVSGDTIGKHANMKYFLVRDDKKVQAARRTRKLGSTRI
jgi:hypothetical protein